MERQPLLAASLFLSLLFSSPLPTSLSFSHELPPLASSLIFDISKSKDVLESFADWVGNLKGRKERDLKGGVYNLALPADLRVRRSEKPGSTSKGSGSVPAVELVLSDSAQPLQGKPQRGCLCQEELMRVCTAFLEISMQFPLGGKMDIFYIMCDSIVIEIENPVSFSNTFYPSNRKWLTWLFIIIQIFIVAF